MIRAPRSNGFWNDRTDDPAEWIDISVIPELLPGVPSIVSTSQHPMKQKGERGPRARFHVVFPISAIKSAKEYSACVHGRGNLRRHDEKPGRI